MYVQLTIFKDIWDLSTQSTTYLEDNPESTGDDKRIGDEDVINAFHGGGNL